MYDDFPKLIELEDLSPEGEPIIQIVRPGEYNKLYHVKTASEALDYIKCVKPIPGKTVILVLAMTAGEFYGHNRNGDAWPERPLRVGSTKITEDDVLPKHYKTFETNANVFKHHVNKDPNKKIGDVLKAFYNWPMHRVELLLALDNSRAEDVVERIERNDPVAVSMGCKVRFDVCSLCGNKAPSRKQYCDHAKYQLGELLPNGKKVFVWNPSPRFFDISIVRRPADRLGYMMKKVAEAVPEIRSSALMGEYVEDMAEKVSKLRKMSIINKVLQGQAVASKEEDGEIQKIKSFGENVAKPIASSMPPLDDSVIHHLLRYHPAEVFSTLSSMGILLTTPEFIKYFVWQIAPGANIPEEVLDRAVAAQSKIFNVLASNPHILDDIKDMEFLKTSSEYINTKLAEELKPLLEKRSQLKAYLYRHMVPKMFKDEPMRGNLDVVNVRDPYSGRTYQTTRGAALKAEDIAAKKQLGNLFGGGALLAGATGLMFSPLAGVAAVAPLVGLGGGYALGRGAQKFTHGLTGYPSARATTGENIYTRSPRSIMYDRTFPGTELVEKRSFDMSDNAIQLAMGSSHRPEHKHKSLDMDKLSFAHELDFDTAATLLGEVIYPGN